MSLPNRATSSVNLNDECRCGRLSAGDARHHHRYLRVRENTNTKGKVWEGMGTMGKDLTGTMGKEMGNREHAS